MGLRSVIHGFGRAIEPRGPDVYDYNHHLGWYSDEDNRRRARFSDGFGFDYNPYHDRYSLSRDD